MGWRDRLWSAYGVVVDTTIESVSNTFNATGSLACIAGGAVFAISFKIDEALNASYYGAVHAMGTVILSAEFNEFNYRVNETIPFEDSLQKSGGVAYLMSDYLHKDVVYTTSALLISSGTVLRALGANIKQWQQGRTDKAYYNTHHGVMISSPAVQEFLYTNAESLSGSLAYTCLSAAIAGTFISSQVISPRQSLTYPCEGEFLVNETDYNGPVTGVSIPLAFMVTRNITLDLLGVALIKAQVEGLANATYGGGLFLKPADKPSDNASEPPSTLPAVIGVSAYLANSFFTKKLVHLRDERIMQETNYNQISINIS
ncbi:hypothetical protein TUM19329_04320 [Legionella antarctica]|uniref:Uncharacterized protein n=1 Tax=Legionella antarctica TaxID=2708020 RepID=A0A6F8T0S9_9GAMM|nr:hypothetical protein [Legionella antarctica]BCA94071.1 hypothetical protein TUM19329_04320 [Legionella antarctica]